MFTMFYYHFIFLNLDYIPIFTHIRKLDLKVFIIVKSTHIDSFGQIKDRQFRVKKILLLLFNHKICIVIIDIDLYMLTAEKVTIKISNS